MSRIRDFGATRLALGAVFLGGVAGCGRPAEGTLDRTSRALMRVEVVTPARQTIRRSVSEPGQLQAIESTPIHAKIAGYVSRVHVDIGDVVKKGQVLAELSVPELLAEHRRKLAMVDQARARKAGAESALKVSRASLNRSEARRIEARAGVKRVDADLARWQAEASRVGQLVSDRAATSGLLDETRSKLLSSESSRDEMLAHVGSAEAAVAESAAMLDQARVAVLEAEASIEVAVEDARQVASMLDYTRIVSPFDGVVIRRNVDTGALTRPGSESSPLFVVSRSDVVTIVLDLPETASTEVNPGDRVVVTLQAMKGRVVEGVVKRTAWALDSKSRTIRTEVVVPNPGGVLRPGLYVHATVTVEEHRDVLTIPSSSILSERGKSFCVLVVNNRAERRAIEVGLSDGERTEVVTGLKAGDVVVKANPASLGAGQEVDPVGPPP